MWGRLGEWEDGRMGFRMEEKGDLGEEVLND
jgi:hypothetical protein